MTRITPRTALLMTVPPLLWAGNAVVGRLVVGSVPPLMLTYIPRARKPWVVRDLRNLPVPRAVVGDQILTDGLLAWRLQSPFIQWEQDQVPGRRDGLLSKSEWTAFCST